jgi:hypothetical protein
MSWFTRRTAKTTTATNLRTTLSLNQLESREVPASLKSNFNPVAAAHASPNAAAHASANAAIVSPTPNSSVSISGFVQVDSGAGVMTPSFATKVTLYVNGSLFGTVDANPNGSYSFTLSLNQPATYKLQATMADGSSAYLAAPLSGSLLPGQQLQGQNLLFLPNG